VLWNPQGLGARLIWKELQLPAQKLGIQLHSLEIRAASDIDKAFEHASKVQAGALLVVANPLIVMQLNQIANLAAKNRPPSIFQFPEFAEAGGLMAYGPDRADMFRRAATFVDKILKGAKPADLPVKQPTKFELVVT
jgi:ABC-type uncharacterized transport system substrate-binding protein